MGAQVRRLVFHHNHYGPLNVLAMCITTRGCVLPSHMGSCIDLAFKHAEPVLLWVMLSSPADHGSRGLLPVAVFQEHRELLGHSIQLGAGRHFPRAPGERLGAPATPAGHQGETPSCCCLLHAAALLIPTHAGEPMSVLRHKLYDSHCACTQSRSKAWQLALHLAAIAKAAHEIEVGCAPQEAFSRDVKEGFQASSTWHQGVPPQGYSPRVYCRVLPGRTDVALLIAGAGPANRLTSYWAGHRFPVASILQNAHCYSIKVLCRAHHCGGCWSLG